MKKYNTTKLNQSVGWTQTAKNTVGELPDNPSGIEYVNAVREILVANQYIDEALAEFKDFDFNLGAA